MKNINTDQTPFEGTVIGIQFPVLKHITDRGKDDLQNEENIHKLFI